MNMMSEGAWFGMMSIPVAIVAVLIALLALVATIYFRRPVEGHSHKADVSSISGRQSPSADEIERSTIIVIPDISGYTDYFQHSRFSLRHAQYVIGELLEAINQSAGDRLTVCRPEGDALLFYAVLEGVDHPSGYWSDAIKDILKGYYLRRQELVLENVCACQACSRIETLELKVIVHTGSIMQTMVAGYHMLAGIPVIVANRLLKNSVPSSRYVLVSGDAAPVVELDLGEAAELTEKVDGIGPVRIHAHMFDTSELKTEAPLLTGSKAVKQVCDLCRKVSGNLKDVPGIGL